MKRTIGATAGALGVWLAAVAAGGDDWRQWGGPDRDFRVPAEGIAREWAADGPRQLWRRDLGDGYSAIVTADETLYTMYRDGDDEIVVALAAGDGATRWEHRYSAPLAEDAVTDFGRGPNATPLISGDRLLTIGFTGRLHCLDRSSGEVLWQKDVMGELGGTNLVFGFASSPLLYKDTVILPIGAPGRSVMAFAVSDGTQRWASAEFDNSYSSPVIVEVDGQSQVVVVMTRQIIGLEADSGELAWSHPYTNQWDTHCGTPVACGDNAIFVSSFGGGLLLDLRRDGDRTAVRERWTSKSIGAGHSNVVCIDGHLYGAAGSNRSGSFAAVRVSDGEPAWRERLPFSNCVAIGDRLLVLDETGKLTLVAADPAGYRPVGEAQLLKAKAWTVPTVVGTRAYLRDQVQIVAIDLAG